MTKRPPAADARKRALRIQRGIERRQAVLDAAKRAAETEEARQEAIAPAAQRKAVVDASGDVIRQARVEPDGLAFKRSSPLCHLFKRGSISIVQLAAGARLLQTWEDGGRSVGMGASNYGERTSSSPQSGWLAESVRAALAAQNRSRDEFMAAAHYCGPAFPILEGVVLDGMDVTAWCKRRAGGMDRERGVFILRQALNKLDEFYASLTKVKAPRISAVTVRGRVVA
jgi:hypothetical protein